MFTPTLGSDIGLYIHIPFCKKKCHYCAFNITTLFEDQQIYIDALLIQLEQTLRQVKKDKKHIRTIYFGGGTPSTLSDTQLSQIFHKLQQHIPFSDIWEISLEMNPEEVTHEYLHILKNFGITRISLGIQTLNNIALEKSNRIHSVHQAERAMSILQESDISWNADLILGLPYTPHSQTLSDVGRILSFSPHHISVYFYTQEKTSVFGHSKTLPFPSEKELLKEHKEICTLLTEKKYHQYEFSNFALQNFASQHNLMYWRGMEYVGIGAGAHGFYQDTAIENVSNIKLYIQEPLKQKTSPYTQHDLALRYLLTSLRLEEGASLQQLATYLTPHQVDSFLEKIQKHHIASSLTCSPEKIQIMKQSRNFHTNITNTLSQILFSIEKS